MSPASWAARRARYVGSRVTIETPTRTSPRARTPLISITTESFASSIDLMRKFQQTFLVPFRQSRDEALLQLWQERLVQALFDIDFAFLRDVDLNFLDD